MKRRASSFEEEDDYSWTNANFPFGEDGLLEESSSSEHQDDSSECYDSEEDDRAEGAFQQVLYIDPGFSRANEVPSAPEVHCSKCNSDFDSSPQALTVGLIDNIKFHIAHLNEVQQNKHKNAKESYEAILLQDPLPEGLKATTFRQLGWLYHSSDQLGDKTSRETLAIQNLLKSLEVEPNSGQSWYLLGRCYSNIGKVHDAFVSYRHSIDKSEANADTWCSIG
eukprot:XP_011672933.1 PREDICTED: histone demethylase UTY-like [Strongylocentrotus purpuratus]